MTAATFIFSLVDKNLLAKSLSISGNLPPIAVPEIWIKGSSFEIARAAPAVFPARMLPYLINSFVASVIFMAVVLRIVSGKVTITINKFIIFLLLPSSHLRIFYVNVLVVSVDQLFVGSP